MQKSILLTLTLIALATTSVIISSCSKDDEKPTPAELTFFDEDMTVDENDGTIEVRIVLNKAFSQPIAIDYDVEGTAIEGSSASSDYEINGSFGEVVIEAGETEAFIEIDIKDDNLFEGNETIELSIDDVNSEDIIIGDADNVTITLEDNDEQPTVSFTSSEMTVSEVVGLEENYTTIEVSLDKPAGEDITVTYRLGGSQSALDSLLAYTLELHYRYYDYYINGEATVNGTGDDAYTTAEVVIPAGETSANIELAIIPDFLLENDEVIEFTLESASAGTIGTNNTFEINLLQDDGLDIEVFWDFAAHQAQNVDLDAFLRLKFPNGDEYLLDGSAFTSTTRFEQLFVPFWLDDGQVRLSYTYRTGTSDDLDFTVLFIDFVDGEFVDATEQTFDATYTLANRNYWLDENDPTFMWPPAVSQTFDFADGEYSNISAIDVSEEGLRRGSSKLLTRGFNTTHRVERKSVILPNRLEKFYRRFKK